MVAIAAPKALPETETKGKTKAKAKDKSKLPEQV
jgi:hypothetical protein